MYDKCYFCLDQLPKLKKESTASFFVNFGGAGVQKSQPTLLYMNSVRVSELSTDQCLFPGPWGGGGGGVNFDGYYISGESLSQSLVVFDLPCFHPERKIE